MVRFLATIALGVIGNAIGLIIAALLLDGFHLNLSGFVYSVLVFTVAYTILSPFVLKMAIRYVPALHGGIALITTFIVLVLTGILTSGLRIEGITTWIVAPLIIWIATILAAVVLPLFLFKKALGNLQPGDTDKATKR